MPRILCKRGLLSRLYTDICGIHHSLRLLKSWPKGWQPEGLRRLLDRDPRDIPPAKITSFPLFGLEYYRRLARARNGNERDAAFLWAGREFTGKILRSGMGDADCIYGFNTASLEVLLHAKRHGMMGIVEQTITPRKIESRILLEEHERFPGWENHSNDQYASEFMERESHEWEAANLVICASEFVIQGIIECGGNPGKCVVVPYGLDLPQTRVSTRPRQAGPLRVLTVGAVGLRKGSPYVCQAAKMLHGIAEFRMAGKVHALPQAAAEVRKHVHLTGIVPRSEIADHYAWADVFLLPSLCEGSATSTYEAMSHHLPVICTPHTGSVVRDGVDGFIVPACNHEAIVEKLEFLAGNPEALAAMSKSAAQRARDFTLEQYADRLTGVLNSAYPGS